MQYSSLGGLKILEIYVGACYVFQGLNSVKNMDTKEDVICQLLILSGSCSLAFGNEDSIHLRKDEIFILDSTKPINFQVEKSAHCLAIYMPLALIKGWIPRICDKLDTRLIKTNTKQGSLLKGFMQLIQKHSQTQQSDPLKNTSYKRAFVPLMVANLSMLVYAILDLKKNKSKAIKDIQLDAAKAHILVHLSDPFISPKTISKEMGFSIRYLHWIFKQGDETVSQYIMRKRIELAQALLGSSANSFFSITEVAFMCGFNDSTHFSRRFKQQVGLAPTNYRNS